MSQTCVKSRYFSGQGSLAFGTKDFDTGLLTSGLRPVGNVSALSLGITIEEIEHKESCTGARGVDFKLTTEVDVAVNFTMECFRRENLELVVNGSSEVVGGNSTTAELFTGYHDLWTPLLNFNMNPLVPAVVRLAGGGAVVPDTAYTIDYEHGQICLLPAGVGVPPDGTALEIDYTWLDYESTQGFTGGANPIRFARFSGLNTAEENKPVVVDIYKLQITPLAELALINDELAEMAVTSTALSDATRTAPGSRFFQVLMAA